MEKKGEKRVERIRVKMNELNFIINNYFLKKNIILMS